MRTYPVTFSRFKQTPVLTIDLLRHGQTAADSACLFGSSDVTLSDLGKAQLEAATAEIFKEEINQVLCSPLQRCAWLGKKLQEQVPVNFEAGFSEMDFGEWEGENIESIIEQGHSFQHNVSRLSPPGGESFKTFATRIHGSWDKYINNHIEQGGHHLLVTHAGVMRVLLGSILHIPEQHLGSLYIPHATWSRISLVKGQPPILWFMNRHA